MRAATDLENSDAVDASRFEPPHDPKPSQEREQGGQAWALDSRTLLVVAGAAFALLALLALASAIDFSRLSTPQGETASAPTTTPEPSDSDAGSNNRTQSGIDEFAQFGDFGDQGSLGDFGDFQRPSSTSGFDFGEFVMPGSGRLPGQNGQSLRIAPIPNCPGGFAVGDNLLIVPDPEACGFELVAPGDRGRATPGGPIMLVPDPDGQIGGFRLDGNGTVELLPPGAATGDDFVLGQRPDGSFELLYPNGEAVQIVPGDDGLSLRDPSGGSRFVPGSGLGGNNFDFNGDGQIDSMDRDGDGRDESFDFDGDGFFESFDRDGDGRAESFDLNGDGLPDAFDQDGNGVPESFDLNGDGSSESFDRDGDGRADAFDLNGDGRTEAFDRDGDGRPDEFDFDGDGRADAFDRDGDARPDEFDFDGDGQIDAFDRDGDGRPDALDSDGDGRADAFDLDGDGQIDALDSDGDGRADVFDLDGDGRGDAVDSDGDGQADAFDLDGDGQIDSLDTDGDGEPDASAAETSDGGQEDTATDAAGDGSSGDSSFAFDFTVLMPVLVVVAALVAVAALAAGFKSVRDRDVIEPVEFDDVQDETVATIDYSVEIDALALLLWEIQQEPDPRTAIQRAYGALETGLGRPEMARRRSETPGVYLRRMLGRFDELAGPLNELTLLFEQARFSEHEITSGMRDRAITILGGVKDHYQAASDAQLADATLQDQPPPPPPSALIRT